MKPIDGTDTAANAVSHHSFAHLHAGGNAQTILIAAVSPAVNGEGSCGAGLSFPVSPAEIAVFLEYDGIVHVLSS
jgi:hypothetical protein